MKVENFPNLGNKQIKHKKKNLIGEHNQKKNHFHVEIINSRRKE